MKIKFLKIIFFFILIFSFSNFAEAANTGDIIFNEIAWMGTQADYRDEWIELYNKTSENINLEGWGIYEAGGSTKIISLSGNILPNGYYLIERTNDAVISDINADIFGPFGGNGLNNNGEYLALKNSAGNIIDEVNALPGWPAGDNNLKASMERKTDGTWQTNNQTIINGKDALGPIIGTPKSQNSSIQSPTQTSPSVPSQTPQTDSIETPSSANQTTEQNSPATQNQTNETSQTSEATIIDPDQPADAAPTISDIIQTTQDQPKIEFSPEGIFINEFLPSPKGKDADEEWIEIFNSNDIAVNLEGWKLDDGEKGSSPFNFPENTVISPLNFLVLKRETTKLALNNEGGVVQLFYPNSRLTHQVSYEKAPEGLSAAKKGDESFVWTENLTPGSPNIFEKVAYNEIKNNQSASLSKVVFDNKIEDNSVIKPKDYLVEKTISNSIKNENFFTILSVASIIILSSLLFVFYKFIKK